MLYKIAHLRWRTTSDIFQNLYEFPSHVLIDRHQNQHVSDDIGIDELLCLTFDGEF